jgi:hypothetical protein
MLKDITFCLSFTVLLLIHQVQPALGINVPFYLGWNRNTESDVAGYYLYIKDKDSEENYGSPAVIKSSKFDATIKYQINEYIILANKKTYRLIPGHGYQIALSAFDHHNNESAKTDPPLELLIDEITSTTSTIEPSPAPPTTTTSIKPDETPPTGAVLINHGMQMTGSYHVTLMLSAEDAESGTGEEAQMSLSNDNSQWSTPEPFSSSKAWILSPGAGQKQVYAKFSDAAGNWMEEPVTDGIELTFSCAESVQLEITAIDCSGSSLNLWSDEKAVDGKPFTGWLSPVRRETQEEYITLDLGETKIIDRADISSNRFLGRDLFPRDFKVQVSTDNQSWTDVVTEQDYTLPASRSASWSFDGTEARYVKLVAAASRKLMFSYYVTYIAEIEVFGCAAPEIPETEDLSLPQTSDEEHSFLSQEDFDRELAGKKGPVIEGAAPGRPGKPLFILKENE